ncbi:hypothetical protein NKDENANG_01937 [Candidatus Entotheonellaceae bacterium PAL068K]
MTAPLREEDRLDEEHDCRSCHPDRISRRQIEKFTDVTKREDIIFEIVGREVWYQRDQSRLVVNEQQSGFLI